MLFLIIALIQSILATLECNHAKKPLRSWQRLTISRALTAQPTLFNEWQKSPLLVKLFCIWSPSNAPPIHKDPWHCSGTCHLRQSVLKTSTIVVLIQLYDFIWSPDLIKYILSHLTIRTCGLGEYHNTVLGDNILNILGTRWAWQPWSRGCEVSHS